jgi:hypothetical protein
MLAPIAPVDAVPVNVEPFASELLDVERDARDNYAAFLSSLPATPPAVCQLAAAHARHAAFALRWATLAARADDETDAVRYAEAARAHDGSAARLAVAAIDLAEREARAARHPDDERPWEVT